MVDVSAVALHTLLTALVGPAHLVRELQATRGQLIGDDNPINVLINEYNHALAAHGGATDVNDARTQSDAPRLQTLLDAADHHGNDAGDPDHTVGDLQELLRAAWKSMTPAQRDGLLASAEAKAVLEWGSAAPSRCSDCGNQADSVLLCPDGAEVCAACEHRH